MTGHLAHAIALRPATAAHEAQLAIGFIMPAGLFNALN